MELISRQALIKDAESWVAVDEHERHLQKNVIEWLKEFPSAELGMNLAEVVDDYHHCRDGEKKDNDVTCDNCDYSEKFVDGLILCRRTKTSYRVYATSTCRKGKREVEDAEAKI